MLWWNTWYHYYPVAEECILYPYDTCWDGDGDIPLLLWTSPPGVFIENKRKIKPKELPEHLIPCLLVNKLHISAGQVEILVTAVSFYFPVPFIPLLPWNSFKVNHGGTYLLRQWLPCTILLLEYMMCCNILSPHHKSSYKTSFRIPN